MKNNMDFNRAFAEAYKKVTTTASYSMELANEIGYGMDYKAVDMPKKMAASVEEKHGGCCFHHAWRLLHELNNAGITAYWAVVPEPSEARPKDQKCVVVYLQPDGSKHVADIVEDIKAEVQMNNFINDKSCKWINSSGEIIDNSCIDLEQMVINSDNPIVPGYLKIYPKPIGDETFYTFWTESECQVLTIDDISGYKESLLSERTQQLMKVMNVIGDCNPSKDLSFEIAKGSEGQTELFLTGNVEGKSLKMPLPNWKFSKKNGGMIVGPKLPVHYEKHWRYRLDKQ